MQAKDRLGVNDVKKRGELDESNCSGVLTEVGEMNSFVSEKRKLVREGSYRDGIGILRQAKKQSMNGGDYGEDEDSSIKLLTKHKAMKPFQMGNAQHLQR